MPIIQKTHPQLSFEGAESREKLGPLAFALQADREG